MKIYEIENTPRTTDKLVLITGNMEYARAKNQEDKLNKFYNQVKKIMEKYGNVTVIDSNIKSDKLPKADKYVGHSRGCGYEHALDKSTYFCLDEYEDVPDDYFDGITPDTPYKKRPRLHRGHYTLNKDMKKQLIKFLS